MQNLINSKIKNFGIALLVSLSLGVGLPAAAGAQATGSGSFDTGNPSSDQYDPPTIVIENETGGGGGGGGLNDSVGPLPFTGLDVIAMLAVALTVTGLGLALQRAVSRQPSHLE